MDVLAGYLEHAPVHGEIVVAGGDDEVDPLDQTVLVDAVVVQQGAAGASETPTPSDRFGSATTRTRSSRISGSDRLRCDRVDGVEDLDKARMVVIERAGRVASKPFAVLLQLVVSLGGAELVDDIQPGKRSDTVDPGRVAEGPSSRSTSGRNQGSTASPRYSQ